jgi:two-component system cell cycle response regulator
MTIDETRVARPERTAPTTVPRPAYLVLTYAPEERVLAGHRFVLHPNETSIGRDPSNSISLPDSDTLSRNHARITAGVGAFQVADLKSTNGTYVNDHEVSQHTLRHGDYVRFGRVTFRFLAGPTAEADYYEEIHQLAISEPRTHLANYRRLREVLDLELARMNAAGGPLTLLLIAVDQLPAIFEQHGPIAADHVIRDVAARLAPLIRPYELLAAPYPSGEFALLLPETAPELAAESAEYVRAAIAASPLSWGAASFKLTASLGLVGAEPGNTEPNALLHAAQLPLRESADAGGNRVTLLDATVVARPQP